MAKIILDRYDIETAIKAYVKDKFLPYGFDERTIHVTQERVVSAKVTFGEQESDRTEALPGLESLDESFEVTGEEAEAEASLEITEPEIDVEDPGYA